MDADLERFYQAYYDADVSALENTRLLARTWVNTGSASRLECPGDAIPINVAGLPIVLTRAEDGEVRAFHNVCRHRGARVLREPCSGERLLRCAYHGWAYGLDGALRGTPQWKVDDGSAPPNFDAHRFGLTPVRAHVWLDQVFVNIDGQAPDFAAFVAPLTRRWANYALEQLRLGEQRQLTVDANWKFAIENYLDTYHLPMIHPQLGDVAAARRFTDVNIDDTVFGICYTTGSADKPKSSGSGLGRFAGLDAAQESGQDVLALYPNTLIEMQPHHLMLVTIEPDGPSRCIEHLNFYFLGEDATCSTLAPERHRTAEAWCTIMGQDLMVLRDLQAGAHSPITPQAAGMSPVWEQATGAFRERVQRDLAELDVQDAI